MRVSFTHVKGHQDKNADPTTLSPQAKANIECDKQASLLLEITSPTDRNSLLLPGTTAALYNRGIAITGSIDRTLRNAFGSGPIREYIRVKNNWSRETADTIDWQCHGRAIQRLPTNMQTFVIKFIHKWLPTAAKQNQTTPSHPPHCPQCQHPYETRDHFITCLPPAQLKIHQHMLRDVEAHCEKFNCDPDIHRILQLGLHHFPTPPIHKSDFPKHLHDLITLQTRAGWNQLYFGRFTIEWINQQEDYSLSQGYKDRSEEWMTGLIIIIFKRMHERWKLRCTTAHEDNPNNESQRHTQLKNEIIQLFDLKHLMPSHTHHIFSPPLQTLLQQPIPSPQTWIECNKSFINTIITQHQHNNLTSSSPSSQTNSNSLT